MMGSLSSGSGTSGKRAVGPAGGMCDVRAPMLKSKVVAPQYPLQRSLDPDEDLLPLSQFSISSVGHSSVRGTTKLGVGAGISTTPGIGKKAAPVTQQPVVTKAQDVVPFGRAPGRSSGPAMLKPKAANRRAESNATPTVAKQPAAFQPQRAVGVIDSSSEVHGEEKLEVGEGRGNAR